MGNNTNHQATAITQREWYSQRITFGNDNRDLLFDNPRPDRAMGTKMIIWLFWGIGLPAYVITLVNIMGFVSFSDAKAFILFAIGVLFSVARLAVYCVENYQKYLYRRKKLRNMK